MKKRGKNLISLFFFSQMDFQLYDFCSPKKNPPINLKFAISVTLKMVLFFFFFSLLIIYGGGIREKLHMHYFHMGVTDLKAMCIFVFRV